MGPHQLLVRKIADDACERFTRKLIRHIQRQPAGLRSGSVKNFWEEICIELRQGSNYFQTYQDHLFKSVIVLLASLSPEERTAIWLQTDSGSYFATNEVHSANLTLAAIPCNDRESASYIVESYVMGECMDYTNGRIRAICE